MMDMINKWWKEQNSQKRTKYKKWGVFSIVLIAAYFSYFATGQDKKHVEDIKKEKEIVSAEKNKELFEEDIRADLTSKVTEASQQQDKKIDALEDMLRELAKNNDEFKKTLSSSQVHVDLNATKPRGQEYPQPPNLPPLPSPGVQNNNNDLGAVAIEPKIIGGIGHVEGISVKHDDESKKKHIIPLPPSFMPAKLLTGVDAMTTELGQGNPETIVFRVQAPAVLPNSLKANLKGCFVVGNATGSLAKERVQVKLVSLHCMSLSGEAVIDERIKGFVADRDGKRDMSGIVVTKAGSNLARSFLAGVFGGIGDAVTASSTTTTTSALGSTSVIDPEKAAQAGLGQGLKSGSQELQKYFLDLAKQATPVIEVGAAKDVTIVIQETVKLEIKEFNHETV